MEHILQFGISIDDKKIKSSVEDAAVKQLVQDLREQIFVTNRWNGDINGLNTLTEDIVKDVFAEHKDEIIRMAAELVAESMKRTKKYKEAVSQIKITEDKL